MEKVRDDRIDALKGVLIGLVVLGHCCVYGSHDDVKLVMANWIYLFHMPFFVFLSGYFSRPDSKNYWRGVLAIIESYVVYQLIKGILSHYSIVRLLTVPAPMMWYLWALVIWRCLYYLFCKLPQSPVLKGVVLVLLFCAGLLIGFFPKAGSAFALSRTVVFAPFFFLGTLSQKVDFVGECKRIPKWVAILILIGGGVLVAFLTPMEWLNVRETLRGATAYEGVKWIGCLARCCYYFIAILMSIALTSLVVASPKICQVGKDSLKYYLFHGLALPIMVMAGIPWTWYFALIWWLILMVILFFFNKTRLSDFALRPVTYLVEIYKQKKQNKIQ